MASFAENGRSFCITREILRLELRMTLQACCPIPGVFVGRVWADSHSPLRCLHS